MSIQRETRSPSRRGGSSFGLTARGIGVAALGSLLGPEALLVGRRRSCRRRAIRRPAASTGLPHFAPKAKRVIFLHQSGGPSQLETVRLQAGASRSSRARRSPTRCARASASPRRWGSRRCRCAKSLFGFAQHGQSGTWVSELLPHTAKIVDDITVIKTMNTDAINHDPAITFIQTGFQQPGRPSMGAWLSYGLGSENQNLPAFVVLLSQAHAHQHRPAAVLAPVGERLPAVELSGRAVPRRQRAGALSRRSAGHQQDDAAPDAGRGRQAEHDEARRVRRSRRSRRASRSTRWRIGCRPRCRT